VSATRLVDEVRGVLHVSLREPQGFEFEFLERSESHPLSCARREPVGPPRTESTSPVVDEEAHVAGARIVVGHTLNLGEPAGLGRLVATASGTSTFKERGAVAALRRVPPGRRSPARRLGRRHVRPPPIAPVPPGPSSRAGARCVSRGGAPGRGGSASATCYCSRAPPERSGPATSGSANSTPPRVMPAPHPST